MIRINLLGQARPKPAGKGVPVESTVRVVFFLLAVGIAIVVLFVVYMRQTRELDDVNRRIADLQAEKSRLQAVKVQVDQFEREKAVLQQRINVIETLQKNRTGGQDLLTAVADTVVRTETLWLTKLDRKGSALDIEGEAGSINAVANFLAQMKRTGYFDKIEIKEAKENDLETGVQTFAFTVTAVIASAASAEATGAPAGSNPTRGRS
jgi:type IV pilus assembly protein PilN